MNPEAVNNESIKVFVRMRPLTAQDVKSPPLYKLTHKEVKVSPTNTSQARQYTFEKVFDGQSTQEDVYNNVVSPLIDLVLKGFNCTVFAYGQTGTGKTHTMIGDVPETVEHISEEHLGMIPRTAMELFKRLDELKLINTSFKYRVVVSFVEVYNEEVRDLLVTDGGPLRILSGNENTAVIIKDKSEQQVASVNEILHLLRAGLLERHTTSTNLNTRSSRSHTVFTIYIQIMEVLETRTTTVKNVKFNLVDLAGSENIGRSGATDIHAREAGTINKSLLTLAKVIKSLASKKPHIPYRESKLTRILQDSLGGDSTTCMIAMISPSIRDKDETVSTLDYAHIARYVNNTPTVNINILQNQLMRDTAKNLDKLKHDLEAARDGEGFYITHDTYYDMQSHSKLYEQFIEEKLAEIEDLSSQLTTIISDEKDAKQQVEETQNTYKKQERLLNKCDEKIEAVKTIGTKLLEDYKNSTKNEEIYYNKYDKLSQKMTHNANVAKTIVSESFKTIKSVENSKETFLNEFAGIYDEAHNRAVVLNEDLKSRLDFYKRNLIQLNRTSHFKEFGIDLCHIIENHFTSWFNTIQNSAKNILNANANAREVLIKDLKDMKDVVESSVKTMNTLEQRQENQLQDATYRLGRCNQRITILEEVLTQERQEKSRLDQQVPIIRSDIETTQNMKTSVQAIFQSSFNSLIKTYMDDVSYTETVMRLLENNEAAHEIDEKHSQDLRNVQKAIEDLKTMIVTKQNYLNKGMSDKLDNELLEITQLIQAYEKCSSEVSETMKKFKYDVFGYVQRSNSEFEDTFANVNWQVHVGDTPAKKEYRLPKNIQNGTFLFRDESFSSNDSQS